MAVAAELLVDHQLILERPASDNIDRSGQGFRCDQAGAGTARDVDALQPAETDAVQPIGGGHRREDRNTVNQQRGVTAWQVVEHNVAHIADRAFGLHRNARTFVEHLGQHRGTGFFNFTGSNGFGSDDFIAQHGFAADIAATIDGDF